MIRISSLHPNPCNPAQPLNSPTPAVSAPDGRRLAVHEFTLREGADADAPRQWQLTRRDVRLGEKKVFAPANLRASMDNAAYSDLVAAWLRELVGVNA